MVIHLLTHLYTPLLKKKKNTSDPQCGHAQLSLGNTTVNKRNLKPPHGIYSTGETDID